MGSQLVEVGGEIVNEGGGEEREIEAQREREREMERIPSKWRKCFKKEGQVQSC